jgi:hypothetical protein
VYQLCRHRPNLLLRPFGPTPFDRRRLTVHIACLSKPVAQTVFEGRNRQREDADPGQRIALISL